MYLEKLTSASQIRNLAIERELDLFGALSLSQKTRVKVTDCIIALQVPPTVELATFDQDFRKFSHISLFNWEQLKPSPPNPAREAGGE